NRRRTRGHRGRGAVRGHGALRPRADHPRLAVVRFPCLHPQLHGAGRADPRRPEARHRQPVLPAGARVGAAAHGLPRRRRDGHRLAGGHQRRVLGGPASLSARLPAPVAHRAHLGGTNRPDLRALLVSVLTLVVTFRSSTALAYAYGTAVTGTITITTLLYFYVALRLWHRPPWLVAIGAAFLLSVDLLFLAANLTKLVHGAWL